MRSIAIAMVLAILVGCGPQTRQQRIDTYGVLSLTGVPIQAAGFALMYIDGRETCATSSTQPVCPRVYDTLDLGFGAVLVGGATALVFIGLAIHAMLSDDP